MRGWLNLVMLVVVWSANQVVLLPFQDEPIVLNRKRKQGGRGSKDFNLDFEFGERDSANVDDDWLPADVRKQLKIKVLLLMESRSLG